jgi:hypothetical protein
LKINKYLQELNLGDNRLIGVEGKAALADGLSWNTSVVELFGISAREPLICTRNRFADYVEANRFLKTFLSSDWTRIGVKHWPYIYARVSSHPAALHQLLQETFPNSQQEERFGSVRSPTIGSANRSSPRHRGDSPPRKKKQPRR